MQVVKKLNHTEDERRFNRILMRKSICYVCCSKVFILHRFLSAHRTAGIITISNVWSIYASRIRDFLAVRSNIIYITTNANHKLCAHKNAFCFYILRQLLGWTESELKQRDDHYSCVYSIDKLSLDILRTQYFSFFSSIIYIFRLNHRFSWLAQIHLLIRLVE